VETSSERAGEIGRRAMKRALGTHTYEQRAAEVDALLRQRLGVPCAS
jgi:hypothetical protein